MVRLQCPDCGSSIDAEPGQEARCPACGFTAVVPHDAAGSGQEPAPAPYTAQPFGGGSGTSGGYAPPAGPVPGAQGYGQGAPPYPQQHPGGYVPQQRTNGMCTASLVLGLVGLCLPVILSVLAIVFGIMGKKQAQERNEKGEGMAVAGIVLGAVELALSFLWFFAWAPFFMGGFVEVPGLWP